jgi:hypothetical protein
VGGVHHVVAEDFVVLGNDAVSRGCQFVTFLGHITSTDSFFKLTSDKDGSCWWGGGGFTTL